MLVRVKQLGLFITILIFRNGYINVCFAGQKEDNSHHTSTFEEKEKKQRSKRLLELSDQKTHDFYAKYIGQEMDVLFEKAPRGKAMHGFTDNYIRVELPASSARIEYDNEIIRVKLGDFNHDGSALKAEII